MFNVKKNYESETIEKAVETVAISSKTTAANLNGVNGKEEEEILQDRERGLVLIIHLESICPDHSLQHSSGSESFVKTTSYVSFLSSSR